MTPSTSLPGFSAPAAGFEQPFDLLAACHDRVRQRLALLPRLIDHVAAHGVDAQARDAAADVLRYFDLAAPHHHEDEERHVFPRLRARGDAVLQALVERLCADHAAMALQWAALREFLLAWRDGVGPADLEAVRACASDFAALYAGHLVREDELAFPAAQAGCDDAALAAMGAEMQARRRG